MSQSALLVVSLVALFVIFLAARGRLATYAGVFYGAKPSGSAPAPTKTSGGGTAKTVGTAAELALMFL